jgi:hypothetical protein
MGLLRLTLGINFPSTMDLLKNEEGPKDVA